MNKNAIVIVLTVLALFGMGHYAQHLADIVVQEGRVLKPGEAFLFAASNFWHKFWWVLTPVIFGFYRLLVLLESSIADHKSA